MEQAGRPHGTPRGRDWPGALRLASLLGPTWQDDEVQARFVLLAQQWEARRPAAAPAKVPPASSQQPGKWNWAAGAIGNDLLLTVQLQPPRGQRPRDSMELELEIEVGGNPPVLEGWTVWLALNLECWCPMPRPDHGAHRVRDVEWMAATPMATLEALGEALAQADRWLDTSHDPEWWRRRCGLPLRSDRRSP